MGRIILAGIMMVLIIRPVLGLEITMAKEAVRAWPDRNNKLWVEWMTFDEGTSKTVFADSQVEYGPTEALGFTSEIDPTLEPVHRMAVPMELKHGDVVYYRVRSKDAEGNIYISPIEKIVVDFVSPKMTVKGLVEGQVLKGLVPIEVEASDDMGIKYVDIDIWFFGDTSKLPEEFSGIKLLYTPPYRYDWDTTKCPDGEYRIRISANDKYHSVNQEIKVAVDNIPPDTTPPMVRIVSPTNGQVVSGDVKIIVDATDDQEVYDVYCFIDDEKNGLTDNPPYQRTWKTNLYLNEIYKFEPREPRESIFTLQAEAKDKEGNVGKSPSIQVRVVRPGTDITPPVTQDNYQFNDIWTNQDANITLTATDDITGVKETHYTINGTEYTGTGIIIIQEGIHTVQYWSIDNVGNIETKRTLTVKIDKTPPTVVIYTDPQENIWPPDNKTVTVTVRGSAEDTLSGVVSKVFTVTDEYNEISPTLNDFNQAIELLAARRGDDLDGRTYTIKVEVMDNTGNSVSGKTTVVVPHDRRK